jgi:hypothetical protein
MAALQAERFAWGELAGSGLEVLQAASLWLGWDKII